MGKETKDYILMCEKALELKEFKEEFCSGAGKVCTYNKSTWLPSQDDLQKMVFDKSAFRTSAIFWNFCISKSSVIDGNTYSMEQLWLAFVMKEKYNKVWNGKDWKIDK